MADLQLGIKISADGKGAKAEITSINGEIDKLSSGAKTANRNLNDTERSLNSLGSAASAAKGMLAAFATAATAKQILDTAKTIDQMRGTMQATSISTAAASANMAYVAKVSNTLGLEVVSASNAFAGLLAATKGTVLQGQATRDIFYSVAKAASALGKSAADTEGMLLAITQMMSKGKVSSEELRGQLGERLPGAFRMAAEAMGKTEAEFSKMLDTGEVVASEFLPKFAKALDETYSDARFNRINQELNKLSNAWLDLKASLIDTDQIAKALALVTKSLENWNSVIGEKSLSQKINEEIKAITELSNSPKRFQFLFREETEKSIAAHQQALDELIKQQEKQNSVEDAATAGINKMSNSYVDAAAKAWKLTDAQKQVAAQIVEIAQAKGFDPSLLLSIAKAESSFDSLAKSSESTASGVFQFVKNTRERFGLADPFNVESSTNAAIKYLTVLEKQFDSTKLAIAGFKQGEGSVQQYGNTVPPQANGYVDKVMEGANQLDAALGKQQRSWTGVKDATNNANRAYQDSAAAIEMLNKGTERTLLLAQSSIDARKVQLTVEYELFKKRMDSELSMELSASQRKDVIARYAAEEEQLQKRAIQLITDRFNAEIAAVEAQSQANAKNLESADSNLQSIDSINRIKQQQYELDTRLQDLQSKKVIAEKEAASQSLITADLTKKQKVDEENAINQLTLKYSQQLAILDAIKKAKDEGKSNNDIAAIAQGMQSTSGMVDVVSPDGLQRVLDLQVAIAGVGNELKTIVPDFQSVREEQLRMNAFWDQYMERLNDWASTWKKITGETVDGFSDIMVAMGKYAKQSSQITQYFEDHPQAFGDMTSAVEGIQQAEAALSAMANTLLAMRENYKEGTQSYNDMTDAAERLMEINRMLTVVEGILAVVHQLSGGDVYTAIPRALGVAAMLASMDIQNSASAKSNAYVDQTGRSGGVFGDAQSESTSIKDAIEIIKNNSSVDLNYSAGMLKSLQSIESAMTGVANQLILKVSPDTPGKFGVVNSGSNYLGPSMFVDPISNMLGRILFSQTRKIVGYGIQGVSQGLQDILANGLKAFKFTDIETRTKVFMVTVSKSINTIYGSLDKGVISQFTLIIKDIAKALGEGGDAFGITAGDFIKKLGDFKINIGKIDLSGLSGKQIQEKLTNVFSRLTDKMAQKLFPGLTDFQQIGEGYAKTFFRVAEGIKRASGELVTLGMKAIDYKDIANKQGDVAAEIVRQTIISQGGLSASLRQYVDGVTGSAEDIIDAYKKLVNANLLMRSAGFGGDTLDRTIINAAGGLDAFTAAMTTFVEKFANGGSKLSGDTSNLVEQFGRLGFALPSSRDAFYQLVNGIKLTDAEGKKLFGQLIALAPAFDELQNKIDSIISKYADIIDPLANISNKLKEVKNDFKGLMDAAIEQIRSTGPESQNIANLKKQRGSVFDRQQELLQQKLDDETQIKDLENRIADEMEKAPGKRNKQKLKKWRAAIAELRNEIEDNVNYALDTVNSSLSGLDSQIADAIAANDSALADQLTSERQKILQQQGAVLVATLEDIWKQLTDGVRSLQKQLASQIASLQGPNAVAALAGQNLNSAWGDVNSYMSNVKGGAPRNVSTEVSLLSSVQSAIMERYNAELALIQQAAQEQAQALQDGLQSQVDAINAATQAQVDAKTKENDAVLKGLQDQLDAANKLKSAIKQVQDYAKAMRLGSNSPLSPEGRLQAAQSQYNDLLRKANSGDAEAMAQLTSASDTYLQAAKEYYGSGTQYSNIFDGVQAAMEQLGAMNAPDPDSIQSHIDSLRESQQAELEQIRKAAQEQITVLQKDVAAQVKDLTDPNKNAAIAALKDSTIAELQKVQDLARITQEEANRQAKEAYDLAQKEYEFSFAQTQYLRAIAENMGITGLSSVSSHAKGGLASGLALVGEKGPELVNFSRPAQVMTAEETRRALSGDEETKTTLAAMLVEMKALVTTQSAANPQMVEKLSNMEARLSKMERNSRLIPA